MRFSYPGLIWYIQLGFRTITAITAILLLTAAVYLLIWDREKLSLPVRIRYHAQEVTVPGYESCYLLRVNEHGEAVGVAWNGETEWGEKRPFLWKAGKVTLLTLPDNIRYATATEINDRGQIFGYGWDFERQEQGICWENGRVRVVSLSRNQRYSLFHLTGRLDQSTASYWASKDMSEKRWSFLPIGKDMNLQSKFLPMGINKSGEIIGTEFPVDEDATAVIYRRMVLFRLPRPSGFISSSAYGLNNRGDVVGVLKKENWVDYPALWRNGKAISLSSESGQAFAINDRAQAVGYGMGAKKTGAMLWENGQEILLKRVVEQGDRIRPLVAFDINEAGMIVGWSRGNDENRGFVLTPIKK